jgi:hypothetical protein
MARQHFEHSFVQMALGPSPGMAIAPRVGVIGVGTNAIRLYGDVVWGCGWIASRDECDSSLRPGYANVPTSGLTSTNV